jgi:Rod binding domain-containing protein
MTNTIYNDIGYLGSLRAEASSAPNKAINEVAMQFEALFVQQMMKSMRDAVPKSDLMQSDHLETYQSMADQQMAVNLSQQGGIGLARMLVEQMQTRGYVKESNPEGLAGTSSNESRRAASDIRTSNHDVTGGNDG